MEGSSHASTAGGRVTPAHLGAFAVGAIGVPSDDDMPSRAIVSTQLSLDCERDHSNMTSGHTGEGRPVPTVTWARLDAQRRRAVTEAAEAEFGAHGFSRGSLNVIARRAGVAKGSLFQYFADKRDLFAYIADEGSQRVRSYMEARIAELDHEQPFFDFLTDLLDSWVAYYADHPRDRSLHAAASLEVDADARISVRTVMDRHYLEVLRPLVREAHRRGDLRPDADTDALLSMLLLIFPHFALAPYVRGMDPILGLDDPTPDQPRLAVRRLVAVLADAFTATRSDTSAASRRPTPVTEEQEIS